MKAIQNFETIEEMYQTYFHDALVAISSNIKERFQQKGYEMVMNLENLLLKCASGKDYSKELEIITNFYESDIDKNLLETQLLTFKLQFKNESVDLKDVIEVMKKQNYAQLLSEVSTILKLILVLPATNSQSERVFSYLRLVKTHLRSTMTQSRLNNLMFLYIHKKKAESLNLDEVAEEFISKHESRRTDFGVKKVQITPLCSKVYYVFNKQVIKVQLIF